MANYIKNHLDEYLLKNRYPFHMPGHKRNPSFFPQNLAQYDFTEIPESDDLYNSNGILLEATKRAANIFGSSETFYLVNGATSGILATMYALSSLGKTVLIARNCHKSVYSGLLLTDIDVDYIYPQMTSYGFADNINPQNIKDKLDKNKNIGAVVITSPTYEGIVSPISEISEICKNRNVLLVVDEAHGSHFKFNKNFPKTSLEQGSDIVIQSLHKTLPALTQSALLHINNTHKNNDISLLIQKYLSMLQTSSPSYVFMTVMDECMKFLENSKNLFDEYANHLLEFHDNLKRTSFVKSLVNEIDDITKMDISRLTFCLQNNLCAKTLYDNLRNNHLIELELYSSHHVIAISTIADTKSALDNLQNSIFKEDELYKNNIFPLVTKNDFSYKEVEKIYKPFDVLNKKSTLIKLEDANGLIATDFLIPYPPGIPIILPGEKINKEVIEFITDYIQQGVSVYGVNNSGEIKILEEKQNGI